MWNMKNSINFLKYSQSGPSFLLFRFFFFYRVLLMLVVKVWKKKSPARAHTNIILLKNKRKVTEQKVAIQ